MLQGCHPMGRVREPTYGAAPRRVFAAVLLWLAASASSHGVRAAIVGLTGVQPRFDAERRSLSSQLPSVPPCSAPRSRRRRGTRNVFRFETSIR